MSTISSSGLDRLTNEFVNAKAYYYFLKFAKLTNCGREVSVLFCRRATAVANRRFDARKDAGKYGRLLAQALPKSIESERDYKRMLVQVETLMSKGEEHLSPEEDVLLDLLAALVERYKDEHYPIPEASGAEVLKHLMEARGMRQADLVSVIGSRGYVSDLVNGRREISKKMARKLAVCFHVPADVFL